MTTATSTTSSNSPWLQGWWNKFDTESPNLILDQSGNGNHIGRTFGPDWQASATSILPVLDKSLPLDVTCYLDPTTPGATGASRPHFRGQDGQTRADGACTWTSRVFRGGPSTGNKFTVGTTNNSSVYWAKNQPGYPNVHCPLAADGTKYTAATISFAAQTITDSANGLGSRFAVGDWVLVSGAAAANNNQYGQVATSAAGTLTFASPFGPNTVAAAGASITITKVQAPWSWMMCGWINTTITSSVLAFPSMGTHFTPRSAQIMRINGASARLIEYLTIDQAANISTLSSTVTIPSGADTHICFAVDRVRGQIVVAVNGVVSATVALTAGMLVDTRPSTAAAAASCAWALWTSFTANGATTSWDWQFYAGPNMPVLTNTMAAKIAGGSPLSPSDWT